MAVFEYKAIDLDASGLAGTVVADTPRQARDHLRERGLTVTHLTECRTDRAPTLLERRRGRAAGHEITAFVRELATLTAVGIPLHGALETLVAQHHRGLGTVIQDLGDRVASGAALAEAMERHPTYFDALCVSITRVGENTGSLDQALRRLAQFREKAQGLRSHVTTALLYPAVVTTVGLAVMVFLMTYVVPNLLDTLVEAQRELPAITMIVKGASDLLLGGWWALLIGLAALVLAVRMVVRSERGHEMLDRLLLKVPVLGELARKENTSRMAVVLAALLESGLQFVDAVRITRSTLRNRVFRRALERYEEAVQAGRDVAGPLAATAVFPPMVVRMLAVGQESGRLEEMLEELARTYDQEVSVAARRLTALLEPLLIVILAVLVGCIAFATILPILEASNVL